jgi:hypothetical protein
MPCALGSKEKEERHLNPVRAKLLKPEQPRDYLWSSYTEYLKPPGKRWAWLRVDRLFGEMHIPKDSPAGRQQFGPAERRPGKGEDCSPVAARDDDDVEWIAERLYMGNVGRTSRTVWRNQRKMSKVGTDPYHQKV